MNDEFLKDLHELERSDEDRSKLMMKGIKKALAERQSANPIERWMQRKRKKKIQAWHSEKDTRETRTQTERRESSRENGYREGSYETRTE